MKKQLKVHDRGLKISGAAKLEADVVIKTNGELRIKDPEDIAKIIKDNTIDSGSKKD